MGRGTKCGFVPYAHGRASGLSYGSNATLSELSMSTNGMVPYLRRDRGKERSLYAKRILVSAGC